MSACPLIPCPLIRKPTKYPSMFAEEVYGWLRDLEQANADLAEANAVLAKANAVLAEENAELKRQNSVQERIKTTPTTESELPK